jgi:ABC-2 type transport system permease protein
MRAARATLGAAMAEAWSNQTAFWTQVTAMLANGLAWVVFWILFFARVGVLRGWDTHDVLLLQASLTTAGGLSLGLFGNARRIGALAVEGGLDAVLALPVPPLAHVLVRRFEAVHVGDLVFGITLFAVIGDPTPARVLLFLAASIAGATVITGFLVATGSLAFFIGRSESGDLGFHTLLMMAAYPADVFTGFARTLAYGLVPAAFVATVPSTLVRTGDPRLAVALVTAAVLSATAGWLLFTLGLRRYTSGSVWTRA